MRLNWIIVTLLFFVNFATVSAATFSTATPVLISIENASKLFSQCSRIAPSPTGRLYPASAKEIQDTDAALAKYLADRKTAGQRVPPQNQKYFVQYVKYSIGSAEFIYGNYFPERISEELIQKGNALLICDGGSSFWGASYDLQTKQVISIEFNGP
jgi:hypothetical protein